MTRKLWILALGLVVGGTIETAAAAQEHFFSGIVLAVAPSQRLVSVEEASRAGAHRAFTIPSDVAVRKAGSTIGLSGVKVGDPVAIEYETNGSHSVARSVEVLTDPVRPGTKGRTGR
jgi:hypothetical protein